MTQTNSTKPSFFQSITELRKWIMIALIGLVLFFGYKYFTKSNHETSIEYDTALIQQQIKNVSKLVVSEGHFAEVLTYKDKKETYIPGLTFDKKALVVINADVTVGFDLSKMKYEIDEKAKIIKIISIPKEEIKIAPDYKYYDVNQSTFNEFSGDDYNKINKMARENLAKKIEKSTLKSNAKNRLISELSNIFILTKSLGWKLQYDDQIITSDNQLDKSLPIPQ
jgi:hypothetical protein